MNRDLLKDPGLDRTLLGDGIATFVAGAIGGPANTTYGENTSVVGMTKVASVWVIGLAAIIAIALGFFSKFTALVSTIPNAVLGGVSLLLYGFIAVNGLKVLIQNRVDFNNTKNVIVASAMLVLGLGGAAISIVSGDLSITISGMSLAAIVGVLLNLCLPGEKEEKVAENVGGDVLGDPQTKQTKKSKKDVAFAEEVKVEKKDNIKKDSAKKKTTKKDTKKKVATKEDKSNDKPKKTATKKNTTSKATTTKKKTATKTVTQKKTTDKARTTAKKSAETSTPKKKSTKKEEANV